MKNLVQVTPCTPVRIPSGTKTCGSAGTGCRRAGVRSGLKGRGKARPQACLRASPERALPGARRGRRGGWREGRGGTGQASSACRARAP